MNKLEGKNALLPPVVVAGRSGQNANLVVVAKRLDPLTVPSPSSCHYSR